MADNFLTAWAVFSKEGNILRNQHNEIELWTNREGAREWINLEGASFEHINGAFLYPRAVKVIIIRAE